MPGVKGKSGGARKGTRPIIKRIPDLFSSLGVEVAEPHQMDIDGLSIGKCSCCGAVWWSGYTIYVRSVLPHNEEDSTGAHWPVIMTVEVNGQPEKHHRDCPMK